MTIYQSVFLSICGFLFRFVALAMPMMTIRIYNWRSVMISDASRCSNFLCKGNKHSVLLTETYGINSPSSKCSSHLASDTIQRMCTSVNSSQDDATSFYDNLKALLKHFAMSPKCTEFLNNALNSLELNSVHLLNWGSTCMAGFMDACVQVSEILIPFLDTFVAGSIRSDETKFIANPKGVYLIQLFAVHFYR